MLKYIFAILLVFSVTQAKASDWDKVQRAAEKAADDVEDAVNEADDDVEYFLEKPETKQFFKRVERNSKRVVQSIGEGVRHFTREVKEEFRDEDVNTVEPLVPTVITTKNLTLLRGIPDFASLKETLRPGSYYFSMNGKSFNQILPLQPGTALKIVPTSDRDIQFAEEAVTALNVDSTVQYCVDTSTFEIVESIENVAVHIFTECTITAQ